MELRHLRFFIAVAEELHFARAAERLHMEQSPLSRGIKELEYDLNAQLFERTTRSTRLTWAGQVFLEDVRRIFAAIDQAKSNVTAAAERDPYEVVAAHVRRLEALRRVGIVERLAEGVWRIPGDLPERGRQYDRQRLGGGVAVELKSHLPIERQARVIGATWLDQQLIGGGQGLGDLGFGSEVRQALQQRADFLIEQGLAERRGQRVILARNLLATLRRQELDTAAKTIAAETRLTHRTVADGERVSGIYRRSVLLASGRYVMLDDGVGFSLVPWRPVIESRLGREVVAVVRGSAVSWNWGRQRGPTE